MNYTKISPFGKQESRGTFDDFYNTEKYKSLADAYKKNDYVEIDFVSDKENIIYLEAKNVSNPESKLYHKLNYQHFPAGLDISDDNAGCELADKLL